MCGSVRSRSDLSLTVCAQSGRTEAGLDSLQVPLANQNSITLSVFQFCQFFSLPGDYPVTRTWVARSLRQLLTIAEECKILGVDIVSLKQNIDSTLPAGRLTFQVLGAVAEFEREMLRERVKAGMTQARRVGKHIGRPARRRLGRVETEKIRLLRSQGRSVRQLAREFGASQWMIAKLEPLS
jgi:Resolvase, N terminal domain